VEDFAGTFRTKNQMKSIAIGLAFLFVLGLALNAWPAKAGIAFVMLAPLLSDRLNNGKLN
jgi:hypothetical protein